MFHFQDYISCACTACICGQEAVKPQLWTQSKQLALFLCDMVYVGKQLVVTNYAFHFNVGWKLSLLNIALGS